MIGLENGTTHQLLHSDDGKCCDWNQQTNETTWDKPCEFVGADSDETDTDEEETGAARADLVQGGVRNGETTEYYRDGQTGDEKTNHEYDGQTGAKSETQEVEQRPTVGYRRERDLVKSLGYGYDAVLVVPTPQACHSLQPRLDALPHMT